MSKKKNEEERKPDLNESDDQEAIEARIKEMMEPEVPKPQVRPISVSMDDETLGTAPDLPDTKKPLSIKVVDHTDNDEEVDAEKTATAPELAAAIEEANQQLLAKAELKQDTEESEPSDEPEEAEDEPADTIVEEVEPEEVPAKDTDESDVEVEELPDEAQDEPPETADEEEKEKPLKHLDSIVPKTKVETTIEDDKTEEAVEDIIAKESDALMAAEDEKIASAFQPPVKKSFGQKLRAFFGRKAVRTGLLLLLLVALAATIAVPEARYRVLNIAGVRSSASLVVLDDSTQQPLRGVSVKLAGNEAVTDQEGRAVFTDLKLGQTELVIEKRAFAAIQKQLIIGWGSNPLDDVQLRPTGSQYSFTVTDFLSGKPVAKVEAVSNEASALSNEKGEIKLTIDAADETEREVVISGPGYREEKIILDLNQKESLPVVLVPERKHVFISNRSGRYDVFKIDIDGRNEKIVLPGTGSERDDMVLVAHPTEEIAALVSTKDNKRNDDGFLLSTLTVLNLKEETTKTVAISERIQIIDWAGSRIVYVQVKEGASGNSPDRHKLVSYDYKSGEFKDLAASNYFNDVMVADAKIYFAPSSTYVGASAAGLFRIEADGSNKQTILDKEVWNIFRTTYDRLTLAVQQDWYELRLGDTKAGKISGEPPSQKSRVYIDSPYTNRSLWVDLRDGKGVLLAYDSEDNKDEIIRTQSGLRQPVRWLSKNVIIYRINTEAETADFALSTDGGEPKKIRDVTNTSGVDNWYFY